MSLHGAYFLELEKDVGTLEVGRLADVMMLNASAIEHLIASIEIVFVMKEVRFWQADALEEIWAEKEPCGSLL